MWEWLRNLWGWLIGDAGAAWIIGGLGVLWTLYQLRRNRPPRVVIQEINALRLLDIHPSYRDKLRVSFADSQGTAEPIQSLEQKKFAIYNNGSIDISEPIQFVLEVREVGSDKEFQGFWRLFLDDTRCTAIPLSSETGKFSRVRIDMPYLNSYQAHKQVITAFLLSDQGVEIALQDRIGKGWSANLFPVYNFRRSYLSRKVALLAMIISIVLLSVLLVQRIVYRITLAQSNFEASSLLSQPEVTMILFLTVCFLAFKTAIDRFVAGILERISSMYSGIQPRSRFER